MNIEAIGFIVLVILFGVAFFSVILEDDEADTRATMYGRDDEGDDEE